jgi:hypothetical protein
VQLSVRASFVQPSSAPEVQEESDRCPICFSFDVSNDDPLVYCDNDECNVGAHQSCLGLDVIPKGEYFCTVCKPGATARSKSAR